MKFKDSGKCSNLVTMRTSIIDPDPEQPREKEGFDDESLEMLGNSMALGQLHPIVVRRNPNDENRWIIVSGERRWRAANLRELETVTCVQYIPDKSKSVEQQELDLMFSQMAGNFSVAISESEAKKFIKKMHDRGATIEQIKNNTGYGESFIRSAIVVEQAPAEIKQLVDTGKMSTTAAVEASRAPKEKRDNLVLKAIEKGSRIKVADVQKEVKGRANMIPATKIDHIISVCVHNCKNTDGQASCEWDSIAMFLRNHVLGDEPVENVDSK